MMDPVSDVLGLVLIFTSTLFYPEELMPAPMRIISSGNALSAAGNLIRAGFGLQQIAFRDILVLGMWSLVFGGLSIRGYYKQLKT
jgi:hypothetical protein